MSIDVLLEYDNGLDSDSSRFQVSDLNKENSAHWSWDESCVAIWNICLKHTGVNGKSPFIGSLYWAVLQLGLLRCFTATGDSLMQGC